MKDSAELRATVRPSKIALRAIFEGFGAEEEPVAPPGFLPGSVEASGR